MKIDTQNEAPRARLYISTTYNNGGALARELAACTLSARGPSKAHNWVTKLLTFPNDFNLVYTTRFIRPNFLRTRAQRTIFCARKIASRDRARVKRHAENATEKKIHNTSLPFLWEKVYISARPCETATVAKSLYSAYAATKIRDSSVSASQKYI